MLSGIKAVGTAIPVTRLFLFSRGSKFHSIFMQICALSQEGTFHSSLEAQSLIASWQLARLKRNAYGMVISGKWRGVMGGLRPRLLTPA